MLFTIIVVVGMFVVIGMLVVEMFVVDIEMDKFEMSIMVFSVFAVFEIFEFVFSLFEVKYIIIIIKMETQVETQIKIQNEIMYLCFHFSFD